MDSQEITAVDVILLASSPEVEVLPGNVCAAVRRPDILCPITVAPISAIAASITGLLSLTSPPLGLPPGGQREDPLVQAREAGDKAVEGDSDPESELAHDLLLARAHIAPSGPVSGTPMSRTAASVNSTSARSGLGPGS